jgi:hypothetical protein
LRSSINRRDAQDNEAMFHLMAQRFTQLDFLGGRYYQGVNDGMDGNNNATDSLCVPMSPPPFPPVPVVLTLSSPRGRDRRGQQPLTAPRD